MKTIINILFLAGIMLTTFSIIHAIWTDTILSGQLLATSLVIIAFSIILHGIFVYNKDSKSKSF